MKVATAPLVTIGASPTNPIMWAEHDETSVVAAIRCPLCRNSDRRFLLGSWADPIAVARCTACQLVYATGHLESPTLGVDDASTPGPQPISALHRDRQRKAFELYDRLLEGRLRDSFASARALQIGCGNGALLDELRKWGFATEGTQDEPDPAASRCHRIYDVDVTSAGLQLGREFQVVVMQHVLERIARPAAALHFAAHHLAPGGVLVIEVPNWDDISRPLWGRQFRQLGLGEQVAFYDRDSLARAVRSVGLEPLVEWSAPQAANLVLSNLRTASRAGRSWLGRDRPSPPRRSGGIFHRLAVRALDSIDPLFRTTLDDARWGSNLVLIAAKPRDALH